MFILFYVNSIWNLAYDKNEVNLSQSFLGLLYKCHLSNQIKVIGFRDGTLRNLFNSYIKE